MISDGEFLSFVELGKTKRASFMLVLFDMEDKDYYPVFFSSKEEMFDYDSNIISETKCRVEGKYDLSLY